MSIRFISATGNPTKWFFVAVSLYLWFSTLTGCYYHNRWSGFVVNHHGFYDDGHSVSIDAIWVGPCWPLYWSGRLGMWLTSSARQTDAPDNSVRKAP